MLTADAGGTVRCWSLVEASSELNNNEAVTANEHYTWTCTWQTRHDHETLSGLAFAHDGSVYAVGLFSTVALYEAATHALLYTQPTPTPGDVVKFVGFFPETSLLLVVTAHAFFVLDVLSRQTLWLVAADVALCAVAQDTPAARPLFAVALRPAAEAPEPKEIKEKKEEKKPKEPKEAKEKKEEKKRSRKRLPAARSVLIFSPESATPLASVTLSVGVEAMCWGKEAERLCLHCVTRRREIVTVVEGEVAVPETAEEEKPVTAFDEVFDVDKVQEMAETLKAKKNYRRDCGEG